jgi:hypothetical protein
MTEQESDIVATRALALSALRRKLDPAAVFVTHLVLPTDRLVAIFSSSDRIIFLEVDPDLARRIPSDIIENIFSIETPMEPLQQLHNQLIHLIETKGTQYGN